MVDDFEGDFLEAEVFHTAFVCLVERGSTCIVCNISWKGHHQLRLGPSFVFNCFQIKGPNTMPWKSNMRPL